MVNIFNWVEIRVRDLKKAKKFYESLFGWKISGKENKDFAYFIGLLIPVRNQMAVCGECLKVNP